MDRVTAFATVAAVLVALGVALAPRLREWWGRPRLTIEADSGAPFVRSVPGGGDTYLRFKVVNQGRGAAKRVSVRVTRWWCYDDGSWHAVDIDPTPLHWVSLPLARDRGYRPGMLDLAPGTYDFVDLHLRRAVLPFESWLILDAHRTYYVSPVTPQDHPVKFIAEVVVAGDNVPTFKGHLGYTVDPPGDGTGIYAVSKTEAPNASGRLLPAATARPSRPLKGSRANGGEAPPSSESTYGLDKAPSVAPPDLTQTGLPSPNRT